MNELERIATLTAIRKLCDAELKELRGRTDGELMDAFVDEGVQKKALRIGGTKVGDYYVPLSKPTFKVVDEREFSEFALDYDLGRVVRKVEPHKGWEDRMTVGPDGRVYLEDSGLEVPGVAYVPEHPMQPKVTGCDPRKVIPLAKRLNGGYAGLLGE